MSEFPGAVVAPLIVAAVMVLARGPVRRFFQGDERVYQTFGYMPRFERIWRLLLRRPLQ